MTLSGHDPCGGAGIQADIEAIVSQGCQAVSVITCLTVQDSCGVQRVEPVAGELIRAQALTVLAERPVAAFKIGLLASMDSLQAVLEVLQQHPTIPVVFDPVLASGGGQRFGVLALHRAFYEQLLPHVSLLTPNVPEVLQLAGEPAHSETAALQLLQTGCANVLVTGTHAPSEQVENSWYAEGQLQYVWPWQRLPHTYHGSGCTLAAACAAQLGKGVATFTALASAQAYAWQALQQGAPVGACQALPERFYWVDKAGS